MNILFICDEYPPGRNGGIGTAVQMLGKELVKQGHSIFVAGLYSYNYGQTDYEEDEGVKIWRLRYGLKLPVNSDSRLYNAFDKLPDSIKRHLNGKKAFTKFINFIQVLIDKEHIDIIEIPDYNNFCQHIGFVVKWPKFSVPLVLKSHGSHTYFAAEQNIKPIPYLYKTDVELYRRADALSAVSKYTAERNIKLFNLTKEIQVLYNGIEITASASNQSRALQTVVFTGSITPKKGIFSLIKAWNLVHKKLPYAKLIIMGKGKIHPLISLLTKDAIDSVNFMGHVNRNILLTQLSEATLAVFPSYSETFGLGVVEAMSLHCPVIYTKRSCGPEIVKDHVDGLLIDPDNIDEIVDSIVLLVNDKNLRTTLAKDGFETAKSRFNIKEIAVQHIAFYKHVITNFIKE